MEKYLRKTMLYKTGVEYGDYTVNHILGCSHGCKYPCYAYLMAHRFGKAKNLSEWEDYKIFDNVLKILKKELDKKHEKINTVQLCFSTDPFMYKKDDVKELSLQVIKLINSYNIPCIILTKGILPKELVNYSKMNYYGITYVSNNNSFQNEYEPNAAPLDERLASLKFLSENGCNTWVSMEPYPTPNIVNQNFENILNDVSFVNKIVFGRLNYNKLVSEYKNYKNYYNNLVNTFIEFCEKNNIEYHIKNGTKTEIDN
ncbi:MAG: hypothetical protein K5892_03580 [Acholeplasmatales bacterium]|nr:hypothetical protein [Acholeplasmatales bacterium]